MPTLRDFVCAAVSATLGAWALYKTQAVSKKAFDPILATCISGEGDYELVDYEPLLGGPLVCLITQFVHRLVVNTPAGFIVWAATICTILPVGILMNVEAGRSGAKGPVRYPTIIGFISICLAISVSVPLVWIPSFLLLGGSKTGAVLPKRAYASLYLSLPAALLTILAFTIDVTTYQWTVLAGLLGGPTLVLSTLLLWGMQVQSGQETPQAVAAGAMATSRAFAIASFLALLFWIGILRVVYATYDFDYIALWNALWTDADVCVQFMTVDAIVLYLAAVLYVAAIDPIDAIVSLVICPLLGPGASCGLMFWGHERVRHAKAMAIVESGKKTS